MSITINLTSKISSQIRQPLLPNSELIIYPLLNILLTIKLVVHFTLVVALIESQREDATLLVKFECSFSWVVSFLHYEISSILFGSVLLS